MWNELSTLEFSCFLCTSLYKRLYLGMCNIYLYNLNFSFLYTRRCVCVCVCAPHVGHTPHPPCKMLQKTSNAS